MTSLLLAATLFATPAKLAGNTYVVAVGINEYPGSPLNSPERDADLFLRTFDLGSTRGAFLTSKDKPTAEKIVKTLKTVAAKATKANDSLWFYYSGHGLTRSNASYLLPWIEDAQITSDELLPVSQIIQIFKSCKAGVKAIVLDGCHTGSTEAARKRSWNEVLPTKSFAFMAAARVDEVAWETGEEGHGLFTYFLVKGLQGAARANGKITFSSLKDYVTKQVRLRSEQIGIPPRSSGKTQNPVFTFIEGGGNTVISVPNGGTETGELIGDPVPMLPIHPGVAVVVRSSDDDENNVESSVAFQTALRGVLSAAQFPVYEPQYQEWAEDRPFTAADASKLKSVINKAGSKFLVRVRLRFKNQPFGDLEAQGQKFKAVRVGLTANAELVDEEGQILWAMSHSELSNPVGEENTFRVRVTLIDDTVGFLTDSLAANSLIKVLEKQLPKP